MDEGKMMAHIMLLEESGHIKGEELIGGKRSYDK
jgi:hypothetical protein